MKKQLALVILIGAFAACSKENIKETKNVPNEPSINLVIKPTPPLISPEPDSKKFSLHSTPSMNAFGATFTSIPERLIKLHEQMKKPEFKPTESDLEYLRVFAEQLRVLDSPSYQSSLNKEKS